MFKEFYERKKLAGGIILSAFLVFSLFSGFIDLIPRLAISKKSLPVIFEKEARDVAEFVRKEIPEEKLILTGTTHLNPVNSLAGRPVLVGYPGWLWTRGLDYKERFRNIADFYRDPSIDKKIIRDYQPAYILLDSNTIKEYKSDKNKFDSMFKKVFESDDFVLYEIK